MSENEIHELLADVHWLRTLARRLARDPTTAEDFVQETCAIALRQDPPPRHWRSWLVGVLRTLVRSERRHDAVRRRQLALLPGGAGIEDTLTIVQRAEVQQLLATAVLQLEEPYRSTVLLRYFEGEAPRRIAARQSVPVATVHSRLQRGLQQLRERLDRDAGGRARWLALTVPFAWPQRAPAASAAASAPRIVASGAAALVLTATVILWNATTTPPPTTTDRAARAASPADEPADAAARDHEMAARRAAATTGPDAETRLDRHVVAGRVCDGEGRPVAGASITAVLGSSPRTSTPADVRPAFATSGPDGTFRAEIAGTAAFLVVQDGNRSSVLVGTWRHDSSVEPLVVVGPTLHIAGRAASVDGRSLRAGRVSLELPEDFWARLPARVDRSRLVACDTQIADDGSFRFADLPSIRGARLVATAAGHEATAVPLPSADTTSLEIVLTASDGRAEEIRGTVLDAAGAAAAEALVTFGVASTRTDLDGRFVLDLGLAGPGKELIAAKPGATPARLEAPVGGAARAGDWPRGITLQLGAPTGELLGRVVDANGAIPGAKVWIDDPTPLGTHAGSPVQLEYYLAGAPLVAATDHDDATRARTTPTTPDRPLGTSWSLEHEPSAAWSYATTDGDGAFVLRGASDRPYRLRAFDPRSGRFGVLAGATPRSRAELALAPGIPRDMQGRVVAGNGEPIAGARVQQRFQLFRHRTHLLEGTRETIEMSDGAAVTTDANGTFTFRGIRLPESLFVVDDDRVLPTRHDVALTSANDLVVVVERRCAVEVDLADPPVADRIACLDAAGKSVWLARVHGAGMDAGATQPLHGGRSGTFVVGDRATTLLLLRGDDVVRRIPIAPDPRRPTVVR